MASESHVVSDESEVLVVHTVPVEHRNELNSTPNSIWVMTWDDSASYTQEVEA